MCCVVNIKSEECDVYIGRGRGGSETKWGNPFKTGSRGQNIANYRGHLWKQIKSGAVTINDLLELQGKRLGCFCKPKSCHGDVIASAVRWAAKKNGRPLC